MNSTFNVYIMYISYYYRYLFTSYTIDYCPNQLKMLKVH